MQFIRNSYTRKQYKTKKEDNNSKREQNYRKFNSWANITQIILYILILYSIIPFYHKKYDEFFSTIFFAIITFIFFIFLANKAYNKKLGLISQEDKIDDTWGKGVVGELLVNGELEKLPSNYHIFCDVKIKHGNIDNVIVCDGGILLVEVKNWDGPFSSNGNTLYSNGYNSNKILKQVFQEKEDLEKMLENHDVVVVVRTLLVVVSGKIELSAKNLCKQKGIILLNKSQLLDYIERFNKKYKDKHWDKEKASLILRFNSTEYRRVL